ncbi:sigma-54-dependent transcriptional regulator [Lignipirellula cremea]|uniref:Transcriptional regulatory protein ZraR n=1 Tax=Lignipirellula cremea TaxID=2528010 RepID=A0A518DLC0_9BACT|nr:sigma-54 dependent transcriptional regulator [Lignipirellula cremea]QDU92628.1 Transcriptional regulatory protein ZraR [Lignipirellula cremea]
MDNERPVDLLIVDDDDEIRKRSAQYFQEHGYHTAAAASGAEALEQVQKQAFQVAILDMSMPGMSGIELLTKLRESNPEIEVVMLTGHGTIEIAVEAMKLGAHDFLTKPVRFKHLAAVVDKAAEAGRIRKENRQLRAVIERTQARTEGMVGESPAMREVFRLIERVGPTDKPILIQGESGTGKELVAKAIHQAGPLARQPLVVINCAALPEALLESELFGHEKGSFTGAVTAKEGLFEIADGGTLFIDEIGELSPTLQPKLLRVLEDGWMRRVGSVKDCRVQVRILAATNRNLADEVAAKRFREDLYYRINVLTIPLPPLRERGDDVRLLADKFTGPGWEWEPAALEAMQKYDWPGNVRQLMNAIERAKLLADEEWICLRNLPQEVLVPHSHGLPKTLQPEADLATVNRSLVVQAMRRERGNKMQAAKVLGVSRRSLYRLLEKYEIDQAEYID